MCEIPNFEELLSSHLPGDLKIVSSRKTDSTKSEVYNCLVQGIEVSLSNGTSLYITGKLLPNTEDEHFVKEATFFHKEFNFYNAVAATLKHFQESEGVDELYFIPEYYGGRLNLKHSSDTIDKNAILLLENLRVQKYERPKENFDLATSRQVLKDLASIHAIAIALKMKDPKVFDNKVKRYLSQTIPTEDYTQNLIDKITKIAEDNAIPGSYLDRIRERLEEVPSERPIRAPFSTLIHAKCQIGTVMVKIDSNGLPETKLIHFQHCAYGSLAEDVILFLYTSVQQQVLEEYSDSLVEFYHSNFVRVLEECRCDPTPFSLEGLNKEMQIVVHESLFAKVMLTLFEIFGQKGKVLEEKVMFVVKEFLRRDWI